MSKRELREKVLMRMLHLIHKNPGIRPRELNRLMNLDHSASLRNTLIKQGVVEKVKKELAVLYYPVEQLKKHLRADSEIN